MGLAIQRAWGRNEARIIAYTVHISEIAAARDAGFDGFLGKPLDALAFPQILRQIVAGNSAWVA